MPIFKRIFWWLKNFFLKKLIFYRKINEIYDFFNKKRVFRFFWEKNEKKRKRDLGKKPRNPNTIFLGLINFWKIFGPHLVPGTTFKNYKTKVVSSTKNYFSLYLKGRISEPQKFFSTISTHFFSFFSFYFAKSLHKKIYGGLHFSLITFLYREKWFSGHFYTTHRGPMLKLKKKLKN